MANKINQHTQLTEVFDKKTDTTRRVTCKRLCWMSVKRSKACCHSWDGTHLQHAGFNHHGIQTSFSMFGFLRIIKINLSNISWQTIATSSKGSTIYTTNISKKKHVQSNPTIGSNSFQSTKMDELRCPNSYYNDFTHVDAHKANIFAFIFIDAAIFTSLGDHVQQPSIIYLI